MPRVAILVVLLSQALSASDARFTDELWAPMESQYQKMLATHTSPDVAQRELLAHAVRDALVQLSSKAPDADWRRFLEEDAARIPEQSKPSVRTTRATENYARALSSAAMTKTFGEGLAGVLAEYWINFDRSKDRQETMRQDFVETVAELTRMMNSVAARSSDVERARLKDAFAQAARLKLAFEEQ